MSIEWFDVPYPQDRLPDAQNLKMRVENGSEVGSEDANSVDDTSFLRRIEVDLDFLEGDMGLDQVKSKKELETFISTMYK